MKKYAAALLAVTAALVAAALSTLWFGEGLFRPALALLPLYFAAVTGATHLFVVRSLRKEPRVFVKNFLGVTVGSLFLHLCVLIAWTLTHLADAKVFVAGFCVGYAAYLLFETAALVLVVRRARRDAGGESGMDDASEGG